MNESIQISIQLNRPCEFEVTLDDNIVDFKIANFEKPLFYQSIRTIETTNIVLSVKLNGENGCAAILLVNNGETQRFFKSKIQILKNETASKKFVIDDSDFELTESDDLIDKRFLERQSKEGNYRAINLTEKETNHTVEVFYATDRGFESDKGFIKYNSELSYIKYGLCKVNVPKKKRVGELPRPEWWKLQFKENPDKHYILLSATELAYEVFFQALNTKISSISDDAFVFFHGFNTTFEESILRTAQIAYDLGFQGAPITYSWPSDGTVHNYGRDENSVQYSVDHLLRFLRDVITLTKGKKIHLIAHSMGNRVLLNALAQLKQDPAFDNFAFNQIILAAPDIDAKVFIDDIAPNIIGRAKRLTLYTSSQDKALRISRTFHSSIIRLGESGDLITCASGIDTIDASKTDPSLLGHGYFSATSTLITDIYRLFTYNDDPLSRNLIAKKGSKEEYWAFR